MKLIRSSIISLCLTGLLFTSCKKECTNMLAVDAGPAQSIKLPLDSATLTGTVTSGLTTNMTYAWMELSGPDTPVILNSNLPAVTVNNLTAGKYVFQFLATNSYSLAAVDTVSVTVVPVAIKTIIIQPDSTTGQDAETFNVQGSNDANSASGTDSLLRVLDWTFNGLGQGEGVARSFIKFTALDTLPANAVIMSAKLSLSAISPAPYPSYVGDSYYPGSPYDSYGDNKLWLQRCTQNWDQTTITFNNQPTVTTVNEVEIPASTSSLYSVTDLDITQLIKDMKATPGTNFGFCMRLQVEAYYRQMDFAASESRNSAHRPKLIITYHQ